MSPTQQLILSMAQRGEVQTGGVQQHSGLSRTIIQRALNELTDRGFLVRHTGKDNPRHVYYTAIKRHTKDFVSTAVTGLNWIEAKKCRK